MSRKNAVALTQTEPKALQLQIDNEVTRCIRQHARAHMKTEVCGVLIGEEREGTIDVQASIEASNAAQAGTHVTFTQDAWEEIYRVKDESYPDHRIVGWYHSHPGFGVFLSEHDTFIHRNFFSSPNQVAWVYDPHTDEEGCFGWVNGEIERIATLSVVDRNGDGEERTPKERTHPEMEEDGGSGSTRVGPPSRRKALPRWGVIAASALAYVTVAMLGFLISFFLFPSVVGIAVDPHTMQPLTIDGRPIVVGRVQMEEAVHPVLREALPAGAPVISAPPQPQQPAPAATPPAPQAAPATGPTNAPRGAGK
jgi:proteasome lid subunit RPN8/RPN11